MPDVQVLGAGAFRQLAKDLRAAGDVGKGLKKNLRAELKTVMAPLKRDAQAKVRAIPSKGDGSTGLRAAIAGSITTKVSITTTGVTARVEADAKKMPPDQRSLPARMEGVGKKWRHPVYGNTDVWVTQPSHPYLKPTADADLSKILASVQRALSDTAQQLEKG